MTISEAKSLKTGQIVYHTRMTNADGSALRAKVTSVKTWVRSPGRVLIGLRHRLYDSAKIDETELEYWSLEPMYRDNLIKIPGHWAIEQKAGFLRSDGLIQAEVTLFLVAFDMKITVKRKPVAVAHMGDGIMSRAVGGLKKVATHLGGPVAGWLWVDSEYRSIG